MPNTTTTTFNGVVNNPQTEYAFNELLCPRIHIGGFTVTCPHCGALKLSNEAKGLCCNSGKVSLLPIPAVPAVIQNVMLNHSAKLRPLNQAFAFTSTGTTNVVHMGQGVPTFIVNGEMQHMIGTNLLPNNPAGGDPDYKYFQIYYLEPQAQAEWRNQIFSGLSINLLQPITDWINLHNPHVANYKRAIDRYEALRNQPNAASLLQNLRLQIHHAPPQGGHPGVYNAPVAHEIAAVLQDPMGAESHRDIVLHLKNPNPFNLEYVSELHQYYDSLQYPLLFPRGTAMWHPGLRQHNTDKKLTILQHTSYYLMVRASQPLSPIHTGGLLFQQYIVDKACSIETSKLKFIRHNQRQIRAESYQGVVDALQNDPQNPNDVGRRIILPPTFRGGPRAMKQLYYDALAIIRETKRPSLFITMTCNPNWPEITELLGPGQKPHERPDIVARVFNAKYKHMVDQITSGKVFGECLAYVLTIEFQKRGLPHCHALFTLKDPPGAVSTPDDLSDVDRFISAELPNPQTQPRLFAAVVKHNLHKCGDASPGVQPCRKADPSKCSKDFPKPFSPKTQIVNKKLHYKRRTNQQLRQQNPHRPANIGKYQYTASVNGEPKVFTVTNQQVVPFNGFLTLSYDCHINVEYVQSDAALQYLFKYITKGNQDRVAMNVQQQQQPANPQQQQPPVDEINQYLEGRYMGPCEAAWVIFSFKMSQLSHVVERLPVHLPDHQQVYFQDGDAQQVANSAPPSTKLTAFFDYCNANPSISQDITYCDIVKHCVYAKDGNGNKVWRPPRRAISKKKVSRMAGCPPAIGERYYLRLLLLHRKSPKSFEDLRTINGIQYDTFKPACNAMGLLQDDGEWKQCLEEGCHMGTREQLRSLFCDIVVSCNPSDIQALWEQFEEQLIDGIPTNLLGTDNGRTEALHRMNRYIVQLGTTWDQIPGLPDLPPPPQLDDDDLPVDPTYQEPTQSEILEGIHNHGMLNQEQLLLYNKVVDAVNNPPANDASLLFFAQGCGGSGKSFTFKAIIGNLANQGKKILTTATSGIAATLLPAGSTAHFRFGIPIDVHEHSTCSVSRNSVRAQTLRNCHLIIIDEAPMLHKEAFHAIDRTMRDLMQLDRPFGGKVLLLGGDFRQIPPVVLRGTPSQTHLASIRTSPLWPKMNVISLESNMRLGGNAASAEQQEFAEYLLAVGEGVIVPSHGTATSGYTKVLDVPHALRLDIEPNLNDLTPSNQKLIDFVYPNFLQNYNNPEWLANRAILATTNTAVDEFNDMVTSIMPLNDATTRVYLSADFLDDDSQQSHFAPNSEYLNSLSISSLPPHKLTIKVGMVVILLRNISVTLRNGTRLVVNELQDHLIKATIISGKYVDHQVLIHRRDLSPPATSSNLPFTLIRRQFPIKPAFAMTINKSQGQSIQHVGVSLIHEPFAHGQLYVALSRVTDRNNIKVLTKNNTFTNVVYPELLLNTST